MLRYHNYGYKIVVETLLGSEPKVLWTLKCSLVIKSRGIYDVKSLEGAIAKFLEANIKSNRVNNSTLVYNMESVEFDFFICS